jgi:hypothetical protein
MRRRVSSASLFHGYVSEGVEDLTRTSGVDFAFVGVDVDPDPHKLDLIRSGRAPILEEVSRSSRARWWRGAASP